MVEPVIASAAKLGGEEHDKAKAELLGSDDEAGGHDSQDEATEEVF